MHTFVCKIAHNYEVGVYGRIHNVVRIYIFYNNFNSFKIF